MGVNAIGASYQSPTRTPAQEAGAETEKPGGSSEISKLNAEIEKAESELKETAKEVQQAVGESIGGSSEKVQLLHNKMQMQQQAILMKQLKIKEIEAPSKPAENQAAARPRLDRYVAGENAPKEPASVYRLGEKDSARTVIFPRPED